MSRRKQYTAQQVADALRKRQGLASLAAEDLGCTAQTVYNYAAAHPSVKEVLAHQKEKRLDMAEAKLWAQIQEGNLTAIIFYLKTQGKQRGYVERQEIANGDAGPVRIVIEYADADSNPSPSA